MSDESSSTTVVSAPSLEIRAVGDREYEARSRSEPARWHSLRAVDGEITCTCAGYYYRRSCAHASEVTLRRRYELPSMLELRQSGFYRCLEITSEHVRRPYAPDAYERGYLTGAYLSAGSPVEVIEPFGAGTWYCRAWRIDMVTGESRPCNVEIPTAALKVSNARKVDRAIVTHEDLPVNDQQEVTDVN